MRTRLFYSILLAIICFAQSAVAQEVIYSGYEKFDLRANDFSVVGKIGNKLFTYRSNSDGFYLDAFDDSMNRTATVILDFFPKKIYETKFITYSNQIVILYQAVEGSKVIQYAALLDENGRLQKRPIQLAEAKTGFFGPSRDYFSCAISEDKKRILIYSSVTKGSGMEFTGTWIDDQLSIVKRSKASYQGENNLAVGEGLLGNDGTLYVFVNTPVGNQDYADQLYMLTLAEGANKFTATEFALDKMYATSCYMKMDNNNHRIYIGGFYSEKKSGNYDGVIFGYYDMAAGTIQNRKLLAFDDRIRQAAGTGRSLRKAFNDFQVRQLIVKNDGGFVLISESYYMSMRNTGYGMGMGYYSMYGFGPYNSPSVREFHYNDILILSYNAEGNREWESFVRKDQYSQEDGGIFSSYVLINTGGTLGFLFNDFNSNRSRIQLASLDGDGKINMRSMGGTSAQDPDWLARSGKQVAAREVVIPCIRKRQLCFAKIVF